MDKPIPGTPVTVGGVIRTVILLTAIALPILIATAIEPRQFDSPEVQDRYQQLIDELRCLVCQNQNLADSNAPLAQDLRREIQAMLEEGQSDEQIREFMVARYGDFVLYRPPLKPITIALWFGPALALLGALIFLVRAIRFRMSGDVDEDDPEREEIRANLERLKADEL